MMAKSSDGGDPTNYAKRMTDKGAWPETHESEFQNLEVRLNGTLSVLRGASSSWNRSKNAIFDTPDSWKGKASSGANEKVEDHSSALSGLETQLSGIIEWCKNAAAHITETKGTIRSNVNAGIDEINKLIEAANSEKDPEKRSDITDKIEEVVKRKFGENTQTVSDRAKTFLAGGEKGPLSPQLNGDDGAAHTASGSKGEPADAKSVQFAFGKADAADAPGVGQFIDGPAPEVAPNLFQPHLSDKPDALLPEQVAPAPNAVPEDIPAKSADGKAAALPEPAPQPPLSPRGQQPVAPPKAGLPAGTPPTPSPSPGMGVPSVGGGSGGGASGAAGGAPSSPLSSLGSSGASGAEQAGGPAQAAAQAAAGRAPTDPLQAFSKGFADSAGTPVHAASSGGAPPPLAPSPAVPASDAMTPASTGSGPVTQTGAQAPAAPAQTPASGGPMGGMGGGMGGMPLGPPPTAPPAAPVAPPAAAPPPAVTPPANIAGGAQVAPIPVSAARAERDAAQAAAKRSSDPLVVARRIAAALNAPDMLNVEDFDFYWITALTAQGQIVVANNYGLAYLPAQVRLPEHVKLVSADESIPASERASFAIHPMVAVQRWAQHHDTTLRAVIGREEHFANSDAGAHKVVLTPEDIPAKGQMAGRDRLQIIAPQIAMRLAGFGDADLINILPPASADTSPPEDRRTALWEAVWEPLCSSASNRGQVHLQAFLAYAIHAQELAVYEAHAATDGPDQRRAVTDFIYWQHVGQLIADGLDA